MLVTHRVADLREEARDFLYASIRRDRFLRGRVTTILSVLLVLALTAAGIAIIRQRDAQEQQRIATARELVAQADATRDTDPRTALLLGIAAQRIHPDGETHASLVNTLTATRYAGTLTSHNGPVSAVAFSPNGPILATGSGDGSVILWDLTNPAQPHRLGSPLTGPNSAVNSIAFSPRGPTLATGSGDGSVVLWDLTDPAQPHRLRQPLPGPNGETDAGRTLVFSPHGTTLATDHGYEGVILWDLTDPAQPRRLGQPLTDDLRSGWVWRNSVVAFSPMGPLWPPAASTAP